MPNLCVSAVFNPPVISLVGSALREETLRRLEQNIPTAMATSSGLSKEPEKFFFQSNPDHWRMEMSQHFCDDLHKSALFLVLMESLEGEGWRLRASSGVQDQDSGKHLCKLFFVRKA